MKEIIKFMDNAFVVIDNFAFNLATDDDMCRILIVDGDNESHRALYSVDVLSKDLSFISSSFPPQVSY